jgi:pimeloyl-ACP methyl ester carboxylesterase
MSLRLKAPLSALALGALALSACRDVNRQPPKETLAVAAFDPGQTGVRAANIPLPNDLALQGAPSQTSVTREVLFSFVNGGGWPGDQTISIPVRSLVRNADTREYEASPTPPAGIDAASVSKSSVAIVRVSDSPPTVLEPEYLGYGPRAGSPGFNEIRLRPKGGLTPGRYVVALRGGDRGVKTADGEPLGADTAIMLIAPNVDLTNQENWPPGFAEKVAADPTLLPTLEKLRAFYRVPLDWGAPTGDAAVKEATCRAVLSIPQAVPLPEQTCWIPPVNQQGALVPSEGITAAFDAVDRVFPHAQLASLQAFEIAAPAAIVDSATSNVPFPSDFLRLTGPIVAHPQGGGDVVQGCEAVRLPGDTRPCIRSIAALGPAAPGIASLDGASTTSLMIAPLSGPVQASTITGENVLVFELTQGGPRQMQDVAAALGGGGGSAEYLTQPTNLVQTVNGTGVSTVIGLQPAIPVPIPGGAQVVYLPPLKPKTTYIVMITNGVKDLTNTPLARGTLGTLLFTVQTPIFDANKPEGQRSNVPSLTDAEALGIQTLRTALRPLAQGIEQQTGKQVVLGYTITTQDVTKTSADLTALPYTVDAGAGNAFFVTSNVADFDTTPVGVPPAAFAQAFPNLQKFVAGNLATLDAMSATTGTLDPLLATWGSEQFAANRHDIPVLVAVPKVADTCTSSAPCAKPLVVFHHGLNGSHYQMVAAADALAAKGFVVVAIDAPFHGDRASCQVDSDCNGGNCTLQPTNQKQPGVCTSGQLAFDPARLTTVASGNYFISENFFRIRDAIRQDLLDHSALVLAAARPTGAADALKQALAASGVAVNPTQIYYAGISLGGMIGTSLVPTNPRISRVALNVPGGTLVDVFTNAPAFRNDVEALLANIIPGFTFAKVDSSNAAFDPAIAQSYAQTLIVAKWALDPAEPINYAAELTKKDIANATLRSNLGGLAVSGAEAYGQMIGGDTVVPNAFNALLFQDAGIDFALYGTTAIPEDSRHGLLLSQTPQGATERADLANFLADLTARVGQLALDPQ